MTTYTFADPPPFQHQQEALKKILETRGSCALLCEPGTGKTRVALDYSAILAHHLGEVRVLVVAPVAALDTWITQAETFVPEDVDLWGEVLNGSIPRRAERLADLGPASIGRGLGKRRPQTLSVRVSGEIIDSEGRHSRERGPDALGRLRLILAVTNLETFASRATAPGRKATSVLDLVLRAISDYKPDLVIVDESHRIKGARSNTSRALARVRDLTPRRLILTGTPMPHSPLDVYGQWRFVAPEGFGTKLADGTVSPWSFSRFRERYAKMGGWQGKEVVGFQRLDEMQDRMARNAIVVRKADALDLPPTTDVEVAVHLTPKETRTYATMKEALAAELESGDLAVAPNRLAQMMRLRQITSGYLPGPDGDPSTIGTSKIDSAASIVADLMASERRVVVFAHFVHEVAALAEAIRQAKVADEVAVIGGNVGTGDRLSIRRRFGDLDSGPDRMVLVAQMRTVSLAVNELVTASHAVFASMSERRDDYIQARDRLDRQGQTQPVTFWHLVAKGTVDEVMLVSHRDRTSLEEAMLRHVRGTGSPDLRQTG